MPSLKLSNPFRRADGRPSLKERAAALKASFSRLGRRVVSDADQGRRSMVAGSLMAAIPLPVLALPAPVAAHPDQHLLDTLDALMRAREVDVATREAECEAWCIVWEALKECPAELRPTLWEYESIVGPGFRRPAWGRWMRFRHVPSPFGSEETDCTRMSAWTGKALREVIALAVPVLGRGGQTPHRIRRWKSLLPIADAFDARAEAVEAATNHAELDRARQAAEAAVSELNTELSRSVATTPEGMAGLVRVIGRYPWKDTGGAWPNLLRSAANVSGVPLADLEHQYDSTRKLSA